MLATPASDQVHLCFSGICGAGWVARVLSFCCTTRSHPLFIHLAATLRKGLPSALCFGCTKHASAGPICMTSPTQRARNVDCTMLPARIVEQVRGRQPSPFLAVSVFGCGSFMVFCRLSLSLAGLPALNRSIYQSPPSFSIFTVASE